MRGECRPLSISVRAAALRSGDLPQSLGTCVTVECRRSKVEAARLRPEYPRQPPRGVRCTRRSEPKLHEMVHTPNPQAVCSSFSLIVSVIRRTFPPVWRTGDQLPMFVRGQLTFRLEQGAVRRVEHPVEPSKDRGLARFLGPTRTVFESPTTTSELSDPRMFSMRTDQSTPRAPIRFSMSSPRR